MIDAEELPSGWKLRKLGEVAEVAAGTTAPQGSEFFEGGAFPFVRAQDVGRYGRTSCLTETKDKVNARAISEKRLKLARKGAVLFPKSGASILTNSRAKLGVDAYVVSHLAIVDASPEFLDDDFLFHWLCTLDMTESAQSEEGYPSLRLSDISAFEIPVPPLAEQRRLVARIEALTSRLEQARQARQAALAEAEHMLPAAISSLLERRNHATVQLQSLLSEQPQNGWSPPAIYQTGDGTPVLTLSAITGFRYDGSKVKLTSAPTKDGAHYWLQRDELLITRSNTPELVGHAAIYDGTPTKAICCDLIMKMKLNSAKADVRFVHYCLRSPATRQFITHRAKGASGTMQKIAKQDVQEIPIPEIPVAEQRRIVSRLGAKVGGEEAEQVFIARRAGRRGRMWRREAKPVQEPVFERLKRYLRRERLSTV